MKPTLSKTNVLQQALVKPNGLMQKTFTVLCVLALLSLPGLARAQVVPIKAHNYPVPTSGCVKYVAPESAGGSSGNTGDTYNSPWTLAHALGNAADGCVIVLRGGTYRQVDNVKIMNQVTLQPYQSDDAWIKGSQQLSGASSAWDQTTNGAGNTVWRYDGWTYEFPSNIDERAIDANFPLADYRDMVFINDHSLQQVDALSKVGDDKFYVDYANDKIYVGTSPVNQKVESTRYATPFMYKNANNEQVTSPNGIVIKGLGFAHFAEGGVALKCLDGFQATDNTFAWNGREGLNGVLSKGIIKGNTFAYNGHQGLAVNALNNGVVEFNHFYENNIEKYDNDWSAAGMKIIASKYTKISNNTVERTRGKATGIWFDISCIDFEVVNNTVRENEGMGIFAELSNEPIIAGNLLENNGNYAILISDTDSSEVWNNTIIGKGVWVKDTDRTAANTDPKGTFYNYVFSNKDECTWITKDNIIKNNIISNHDILWWEYQTDANIQVKASNYNGYYRASSTTGPVVKWEGTNYNTLAAFKNVVTAGQYDGNSKAYYGGSTHPFFISGTYRLKIGSPASGAGQALPSYIAKALGWPSGVAVDMGAFQNQTLGANADAYVFKDAPNTNYGSSTQLTVKIDTDPYIRQTYIKFPINGVAGTITNARIRLYGGLNSSGSVAVDVFASANNSWSESTIVWDNKPGSTGSALDRITVGSTTDQWFELDVTNYVKNQQANGASVVSFALKGVANTSPYASFNSSEATANKPELIVDYAADAGATTAARLAKEEVAREETGQDAAVVLYPNPAREQLLIAFTASPDQPVAIAVINAASIPVLSLEKVLPGGRQEVTLDVSRLSMGLYFVTIHTGTERITKKLLITR